MWLTQTLLFGSQNIRFISKCLHFHHHKIGCSKLAQSLRSNIAVSNFIKTPHQNARFLSQGTSVEDLLVSDRNSLPSHIVLNKDGDLLDNLETVIKAPGEVKKEFANLQEFGLQNIKETTHVGELNSAHNRKKNMLPYDNNKVELSKAVGAPPSTYINASPISFPSMEQKFIALSAPQKNSFASFWQMVLDHKVNLIVMITDFEEGDKVKADMYWPDSSTAKMDLSSGVKVNYVSHSDTPTYRHTRILVENPDGESREVDHVHSRAFKDGALPKDTRVILDLLFLCEELVESRPGPVAVHCSGGAGRTGTFIAVFKLATEFHMEEVEELDVFETVVTMWRQRMKMVNKPEHYHYIFKCLSHYVTVNLYAV